LLEELDSLSFWWKSRGFYSSRAKFHSKNYLINSLISMASGAIYRGSEVNVPPKTLHNRGLTSSLCGQWLTP